MATTGFRGFTLRAFLISMAVVWLLAGPSLHAQEELAAAMRKLDCAKPVYALIAGRTAREGVTMGHAGAMIQGNVGTIASKTDALAGAGARVFTHIRDLVDAVSDAFGSNKGR